MQLHSGRSANGVTWALSNERIAWVPEDARVAEINAFEHAL